MKKAFIKSSFIALILLSEISCADEYFGRFRSDLEGTIITNDPRPVFKLSKKFEFHDPNGLVWSVPAGTTVDGASIPTVLWSFIGGPFSGKYINASVIHDYFCKTKDRTDHDTHRNFFYGMRAQKVPKWKAKFMYWAVSLFGPTWRLERRVVYEKECATDSETNCPQLPTLAYLMVSPQNIDLGDPHTWALSMSKAIAVARTLKTTNGRVLDVSDKGEVRATFENISNSADNYRAIFAEEAYLNSPEKLGVLSEWELFDLDLLANWKDNKVPSYQKTAFLKPGNRDHYSDGGQFKLSKKNIKKLDAWIYPSEQQAKRIKNGGIDVN